MQLNYRIILHKEPEGGYTVRVPSLPGCITYGGDIDEAMVMAKEVVELFVESLKSRREEIKDDSNTFQYLMALEIN